MHETSRQIVGRAGRFLSRRASAGCKPHSVLLLLLLLLLLGPLLIMADPEKELYGAPIMIRGECAAPG